VWNFKVIPIALGFQYLFSDEQSSFRPYAGINLSYCFIEIHGQNYSDTGFVPDDFVKKNNVSIEPNIGVNYKIVEKYYLTTEIKYRAMSDVNYWSKEVNLSSLIWNIGIQIKIL
jgi:outer membrane protein W